MTKKNLKKWNITLEKEEIEELMKRNLRERFELFDESHRVNVHVVNSRNVCIGYRTTAEKAFQLRGTTHFDIQIIEDICYILHIELEKEKRGRGIGWSLYELIHNFAKDMKVRSVRQTPSGWTHKRKTRGEYLLERGYRPFGRIEVELAL